MQSPDPCSHEVPLAFSGFIINAIRVRVTFNVFCVCEAVSNETTLSGEENSVDRCPVCFGSVGVHVEQR